MAAAQTEQPGNAGVRTVRLDLTSLDLRSGTIRLPLQEHDCFPAGSLTGVSRSGGGEHRLHFEPPRELHGLREFFEENDLRPNDAVIIHLHGSHVELEPLRRRSRRKPAAPATPADEPEQPAAEADSAGTADEPAAPQPAAATPAEEPPEPAAAADGIQPDEPLAPGPEPAPEPPAAAEPAHAPDPDPEPPAPQPGTPEQSDRAARYPFLAAEANTPELPAPPPREAGGGEDAAGEIPVVPAAQHEPADHHVTVRRPFTPRERGPAYVAVRPAAPWLEAAARARRGPDSEPAAAGPVPQAEEAVTGDGQPAQQPPPPPAAAGPEAAVRHWLERPDLPSIIQAAEAARQLKLEKEEVSAILEKLSAEPDSRLSSVRPGFWLLRRQQPGS